MRKSRLLEGMYLLDQEPTAARRLVNHNNWSDRGSALVYHSNFCPINFRR